MISWLQNKATTATKTTIAAANYCTQTTSPPKVFIISILL